MYQGQCHHIAIGDVRHFVTQHSFDLIARHAGKQAGRDGHQRRVFESARGKSIGLAFINRDFGHADIGTIGQALHGLHNPGFIGIARLADHGQPHGPFGHALAHQQRDDGTGKTHHQRKHHQRRIVDAISREIAIQPENRNHDAQHQHHRQVGCQEKKNAFHGIPFQSKLRALYEIPVSPAQNGDTRAFLQGVFRIFGDFVATAAHLPCRATRTPHRGWINICPGALRLAAAE